MIGSVVDKINAIGRGINALLVTKVNGWFTFCPFLVVIKMTPLAALEPNSMEAEASFKTSIDSISSGLISANGFMATPPVPNAELLTG